MVVDPLSSSRIAVSSPEKKIAFAALHHRDYRRYFIVNLFSAMGDNIEHVISYWLLYQKFHSPVLAGFAVISHWTPFLLFAVYFGALADRHDCRRVIQASQVMYAAVSLTWAILFLTDTIQVWHACVLLVVHGMAGVLGGPGSQLIIHDIVGREYLQSAVRLNSTGRQLGILLGPAIGGATMLLFGPPMGLFINVLMFVPMVIFMFVLPYTGHGRDEGMSGRAPRFSLSGAIQLMRETSANPTILSMILLGGATSLLVGNAFQAQMPEFAHDYGHSNQDVAYSVLLGANAAGAVIGGILLEGRGWLKPGARNAAVCSILWCLTIIGFAASQNYYLSRPATFLCGASKPGVHVDGADTRSAPGADPTTRPVNRVVQYLQQRAEGFQRRDRRCCRRTHWRTLVIGAQLDDPIGRDGCAICVRDSRAGKRRVELKLEPC